MLDDCSPGQESMGKVEKCKPDYERMISQAKENLSKNINFQDAIFGYMGKRRLRNKMAELLGELVSEERSLQATVDDLIKKQETDSKESS